MYFKKLIPVILMSIIPFLASCGKKSTEEIVLTGNIISDSAIRSSYETSPTFVAVSKTMDYDKIMNEPIDNIIELAYVSPDSTSFSIDLSETGSRAGDQVYIFAFTDNGYIGGFPSLSEGDLLGFYINSETYDPAYVLQEGNNYIEIDVNRRVYDFDATVSGTVVSEYSGKLTVIAYAGALTSFNFDDIDLNSVIGYSKFDCKAGTNQFSFDILPYGYNVPIGNVYIFAFLDKNENGKPDAGDYWGSSFDKDGYPETITITDQLNATVNLTLDHMISESSGYKCVLQGSFEAPTGYGAGSPPVYMIVCKADDPENIFSNTMESIKYFEKVPDGSTTFSLDLSGTDLVPGDKVMIIALWDIDYLSGLPRLSEGDMLGYYINSSDYSYQYTLQNGLNSGISLKLNKTYRKNSASVSGTVQGNDSGDLIIVAYTGEINSYNLKLDADKIIGYEKISKTAATASYTMDILPFTSLPVSGVYVFTFLDRNSNGTPDSGDTWGCYCDSDGYPLTVTIGNSALSGINMNLDHTISATTTTNISLQGGFTAPSGYSSTSAPVFMIVCQADDPDRIFTDTMDTVKYFEKLPAGATSFNLDLSSSGLVEGDDVMIIALWDRDYVSGFPKLTAGDMIGYYINKSDYDYQYTLKSGVNSGITLDINKTYSANNATVSGTILGNDSGDVIIIAYTGEFTSLDTSLDTDKIIGYKKMTKGSSPLAYTMDIMPFTSSFPVSNAFIFAILDKNSNGIPDNGDVIGFYTNNENKIPSLITVQNGSNTGYNIEFLLNYVEPSTGGTSITLSGSITAPTGYTTSASSKPIFLLIARGDNTFELFNNPMNCLKYFVRLPQGSTSYDIDLSNTGLKAGDEIRILALWDRNFKGGFPNPDAGDKIGYYQNKSDFSFSIVLENGANHAALTNGWSFGINKTLYNHNGQFQFKFRQNTSQGDLSASKVLGNDVLVVMIYQDGVDDSWDWRIWSPPSYAITDMDYIISIDYINEIPNLSDWYTVSMFPFIYDKISLGSNPLSMRNVYIYVILDSNGNGWPDTGEYVGYYWTWLLLQKAPAKYPVLYYDRVNVLEDEVVTFTTNKYE